MSVQQIAVVALLVVALAVLAFGFATKRLPWQVQGCCCPADPAKDLRMRAADERSTPVTD